MTVVIIANGDMGDPEWIRPLLATATLIIAADGGSRYLHQLKHPPHLVVGDNDSLTPALHDWLTNAGAAFRTYPKAKDETDLELALLVAAAETDADIVILGATGGRLDQTLGNVLLLAHPALYGRSVQLQTRYQRIWLAQSRIEVHGEVGDTVSLIPLGGDVEIAQTTGLKWSLAQETLAFGPARGISNEITAVPATVDIAAGQLLCIHTTQHWDR